MQYMSSAEVRQAFLDFFEEMGHRPVASSSLVPADDPTLLFVNAGMVQFKDVFLGLDKRAYSRATTSQKCMRVSGKHNDLENVGPSPRHHTFFEMLGNFSFGDYFKAEAIKYAYTLLTEVYKLPAERLVFTVYENDDEAYAAWTEQLGIDPKRVARMGPSTNFWQMADTGPCGPTSEIHWDKTPEDGDDNIIPKLQAEDDRFLEIWNLVFMQYNRLQADPEHSGKWDEPLPAPGVDTGLGFERVVSILQGKTNNYETDLFTDIIRRTQELTGQSDGERDANIVPYRVIADHIRAAVFLISDGVLPGAKGRAAIPRIVIRRAARFGSKIGLHEPFLAEVADAVIENMGEHYGELVEGADSIKRAITLEEERFLRTMERGVNVLGVKVQEAQEKLDLVTALDDQRLIDYAREYSEQTEKQFAQAASQFSPIMDRVMESIRQSAEKSVQNSGELLRKHDKDIRQRLSKVFEQTKSDVKRIPEIKQTEFENIVGKDAFELKATLGLPIQVTKDMVEERGLKVDEAGFAAAEAEHARISGGGRAMGEIESVGFYRELQTELELNAVDYQPYADEPIETTVLALAQAGSRIESAIVGDKVEALLAATNFYVEAGGQVSDTGFIQGEDWLIEVEAMKQPLTGMVLHVGEVVEGVASVGDRATARLDSSRRLDIIRNHSATHLVHAALRAQLGNHVQQKGSLVAPDRLRFDFSHPEPVSPAQLADIADEVKAAVLANLAVRADFKSLEQARAEGAMALFGEKYGETVRAVTIGSGDQRYSYELCGGAHVAATAEIGSFVFTSEGSVSAGIRRVEALTGRAANAFLSQQLNALEALAHQLGAPPAQAAERVAGLQSELAMARREISTLRRKQAKHDFDAMLDRQLENLNGVQALLAQLDNTPAETMREMTDWFRNRVERGVMVLASDMGGRPQIVVAVSDGLVKSGIRAGDLIKPIAKVVGGGGGGRPQMAQAGGRDSSKIGEALELARDLISGA